MSETTNPSEALSTPLAAHVAEIGERPTSENNASTTMESSIETTLTDSMIAPVAYKSHSSHAASKIPTPASSVTGIPVSKLKTPSNFGSTSSVSKIGRPCCTHTTPKAGPPPRDRKSMSRESDDNLSSINSTYTDLYQETVKRFTRSSLSPTSDWERSSPSRRSYRASSTTTSTGGASGSGPNERRTSYDNYLEATGRRRSSDHGAVLTADTEQFIIGQHVWVGGIRPGQIAYIGETHFAPGEWAGIVLDEPNGKNDGCVSGKRYFQCEPKRGIFSRLTRLTIVPLAGATTPTSPFSKNSPERSRTVSPTASLRSSMLRSPGATGKNGLTVGDRVIVSSGFGSRPGILRYLGETQFAPGNWCGVELDEPSGKNDGAVDGVRYFECKEKYGVFVPIAKVSLSPSSKKTRLSRTGSRESLTSIGTMNSIATTNTSRMRMNAQRKSSISLKPIATPKSQFSMQDLLRDKQNYIERLMNERDLDREDAQNQAHQLQKNINELNGRIVQLENQLAEERKKTEDLQFSVDEATFCGDELNAQTQVYKEKIHVLEKKITELVSASPSLQSSNIQDNKVLDTANERLAELESKLAEQAHVADARTTEQLDEEKRLHENIKYLQSQNEMLQKELLGKDESLEKFSLSEVGIENLRRELTLLKEENDKSRTQVNTEFLQSLTEKDEELKDTTAKLIKELEEVRMNGSDEKKVFESELAKRDEELKMLHKRLDELDLELNELNTQNAILNELLKTQQADQAEGQNVLAEKIAEIGSLQATKKQLEEGKSALEAELSELGGQVKIVTQQKESLELQLQEASKAGAEKAMSLHELEILIEAAEAKLVTTNAENEQLKGDLNKLRLAGEMSNANEEALRKELEVKQKTCWELEEQAKNVASELEKTQIELATLKKNSEETLAKQANVAEELNAEINKLKEDLRLRESQSSTSVNEMSTKIADLQQRLELQEMDTKRSTAEIMEERNKFSALQKEHEEQCRELKSNSESLATTNNTLQKLTHELEAVKGNNKELEAQLKVSEEAKAQLKLELGDMTRKHEALTAKCENLLKQNETLQTDLLAIQSGDADLQNTLKKLNDELSAKQKSYVELESQANSARLNSENEIETLKQSIVNAQKDFAELKDTLGKTKDELAGKCSHVTVLEEKTIKQELAISDASRQQENLQTRYDALAAQNESLQNDLTTVRTSSTDSNAEMLKMSQDIVTKQKAYEELCEKSSSERAVLEGQLQASQQRVDALCSQVETLTQELKSVTEESFQRFEQLKLAEEQTGKQTLELSDFGRKLETLNTKCENLEQENAKLQAELNTSHSNNTENNTKLVGLNEKLLNKQKELDVQTDKHSTERLQLESQAQELNQRLQAAQNEADNLRAELVTATEAKSLQATEFASLKSEISTKAHNEMEETKTLEAAERQKLITDFEKRLKDLEEAKNAQAAVVLDLQNQVKEAKEELQKTQLDGNRKAEDLEKQLAAQKLEKDKISSELQQLQNDRTAEASNAEHTQSELAAKVAQLTSELEAKQSALQSVVSESEQLKLQQTNTMGDLEKLQATIIDMEETLQITQTEVEHRIQVAREDGQKMVDLRTLIETLQKSNANISATNAELSAVLEVLQAEKSETAHIFELFEMEADYNADVLFDKLTGMKNDLAEMHEQMKIKSAENAELEQKLAATQSEVLAIQTSLAERESSGLDAHTKQKELEQANAELMEVIKEKDTKLAAADEFNAQLAEYKNVIDEMDEDGTAKSTQLLELQQRIKELEQALLEAHNLQKTTQLQCKDLSRKLESVESEKSREILALQTKVNGTNAQQQSGSGDGIEITDGESTVAQIHFLNSIIIDMQKKNDTLKTKIEALEALPTDFTKPHAFDMITKRKPAPRVFCDICDEFDKHETEDCPIQASDDLDYSPPPTSRETNNNGEEKERKLPPPRKYCETCEVFGHETGECADDDTY